MTWRGFGAIDDEMRNAVRKRICLSRARTRDNQDVHVEVAIKDAFAAARRQIEALAQRASGKVKLHFRKPQNR
jgi:hypothetical protein